MKKPPAHEGSDSETKIEMPGRTDIPGVERTAVAVHSIPLALGMSTLRESDSSRGENILRFALASKEGE